MAETMQLKHDDLVELRKKVNKARETQMKAQIAGLEVETFQIELAKKYSISEKQYKFDWNTGKITITPDPIDQEVTSKLATP